jgi:pyruvate/2-oxoglutarate dehydrogenase complex dihydrolipoamide acyltransferase (E2) component
MFRWIALGLVAGTLSATAAFAQQPPAAAPAQQAAAAPAARMFASDAGMVLNFIKPDKTADFEAVVAKLKEALQKSAKPERKQQAASWKVFKSPDPAAGGNVLYVFMIDPAVKGADYTVSTILAEAFPQEVQALYKQYAEAYASGQNFVNLSLVSDLGK